jgi:hypothetical protein
MMLLIAQKIKKETMKRNLMKLNALILLIVFVAVNPSHVFSQLPASLEREIVQLYSDLNDAFEIISTQNESKAVAELSAIKPQLKQKARSLSARLSEIPDFSEAEEEAWNRRMMEKQELQDMMALLSNQSFIAKVEGSQVLQQEFEELMSILDLGLENGEEQLELSSSQACSFVVGSGSPLSGTYVVNAMEDQAFAFDDTENDQFVIEIHGENYIDVMLIIEKPVSGKHTFTMEMQVAIDVSKNDGEDYFGLDNHQEEGGGYIQIDRLDDPGGLVSGSFRGIFNDSSTGDDRPVDVEGRFSVKRE